MTKWQEIYRFRKESGLCTKCGKRPPVDGQTLCKECRDYKIRYRCKERDFYKSLGYCTVCHKERIGKDEMTCPTCRAKTAISREKSVQKAKNEGRLCESMNKAYRKAHYDALKSVGLCVRCQKRRSVSGRVLCPMCADKNAESTRLWRYRKMDKLLGQGARGYERRKPC